MKIITIILTCLISLSSIAAPRQNHSQTLKANLQEIVNNYATKYQQDEYFSGISIAVAIPNQPIMTVAYGNITHNKDSNIIDANTLFQIGSITKSFTAVIMLKLAAQGKIDLDAPIKTYLPQYSKWGELSIRKLLDMSSGLPNYTDSPTINYQFSHKPPSSWKDRRLLAMVYPKLNFNPPLKSAYFYSNTGYILAAMIAEKVTGKSFKQLLQDMIFSPLKLDNSFYPVPNYTDETLQRLAHGYGFNQYDNPGLVGKDISKISLSWAAAAGGIVATPTDIANWVKAIFIDNNFLTQEQKNEMQKSISLKTGKAITTVSAAEPRAFGLGIIQGYNKGVGKFWYYQGETIGFRAWYFYVPCNQIIITAFFNSATNGENNHAHQLLEQIYKAVLTAYPRLQCESE